MVPTGVIIIQFAHNVVHPTKCIVMVTVLDVMHVVILIAIFVILPPEKLVEDVKVDMAFLCILSEVNA
jgi:hypothetical protein